MFIIIGIMFAGMLLGFLLRKQRLSWIHKVITVFIWLLLFLLGIDVGSNQEIINGITYYRFGSCHPHIGSRTG